MERRNAIKASALILGYGLTATTTAAILNGCKAEAEASWSAQYLSADKAQLIEIITDRMIPKTDTPGAVELGVPKYIDLLYGEYANTEDKNLFDQAISLIENKVGTDQTFTELTETNQIQLIQDLLKEEDEGMTLLHEWIVTGYCTTESVCKNILVYDPIPGEQQGCIPVSEVGGIRYQS